MSLSVVSRTIFVGIGIVALVAGYFGLEQRVHLIDGYSAKPLDLIYYDLQLFVLGSSPLDGGGNVPWLLEIARFAAPAVTIYALVEAARAVFAAEIMRVRTRRSRGHDIVCGNSLIAEALVGRLAAERRRVVQVLASLAPIPAQRGRLVVTGSPVDVEVLRNAGIGRARALYVCTDDSAQNLAIADLAAHLDPKPSTPLDIHVHVDDPEFCLSLQARRLGLPTARGTLVNFFSAHELAARMLMETHPIPVPGDGRPPRIMIVGATRFAMALTVELARHWRLADARRHRLNIIMVDEHARAAMDRLVRLYPFVADVCELTIRAVQVSTLLDGDLPDPAPDRVYLCCADDAVSLKLALTTDHFWRGGPQSLVVRLRQLGRLGTMFAGSAAEPLLEGISGKLDVFDAVHAGSDPRLVEDSLVERLARVIHEHYLAAELRAGVAWSAEPAMRPWHELTEAQKAENRNQAIHIGTKLQSIGCALAPNPVWGEAVQFDTPTIEHLAELEHKRWCEAMARQGWSYGPERDLENKRHPDLVDWSELTAASRDRDLRVATSLPEILADAGFQIVRITGTG